VYVPETVEQPASIVPVYVQLFPSELPLLSTNTVLPLTVIVRVAVTLHAGDESSKVDD
jgi:hypothetical protein